MSENIFVGRILFSVCVSHAEVTIPTGVVASSCSVYFYDNAFVLLLSGYRVGIAGYSRVFNYLVFSAF